MSEEEEGEGEGLIENPAFNVNEEIHDEFDEGSTALHLACYYDDHYPGMVPALLAHPRINLNPRNVIGNTPFLLVGNVEVAKFLFKGF
jgi:hypothetical protein